MNWYDTKTLAPLPPRYISTVDSGNLLGCLLTLKQGLQEKIDEPIPAPFAIEGLADAAFILHEESRGSLPVPEAPPRDLFEWRDSLDQLAHRAAELKSQLGRRLTPDKEVPGRDRTVWIDRVQELLAARQVELEEIAPWLVPLQAWRKLSTKSSAPRPSYGDDDGNALDAQLSQPVGVGTIAANVEKWAAEVEDLAAKSDSAELRAIAAQLSLLTPPIWCAAFAG